MRIIRSVLEAQDLNVKVVLEDIFADFKNCHEKCRLCFVPVTKRYSRIKITDEIQNKINSVLQVHLSIDRTGSEFICSECGNNLNNVHLFKCKIKEKQNYFEKFSNKKVGDTDDDLPLPFQEHDIKTEYELNISTETELTTPIYEVKDEIFDPEHESPNDVNESRNVESSEFLKQKQSNPQFVRRDVTIKILRTDRPLQQHKYRKDSKARFCDICGKAFKNRAYIAAHMNTHKKYRTKDYHCHICENKHFDKKQLKIHTINAHGKSVSCDICGEALKNGLALKRHKLTIHSKKFPCEICGKGSRDSYSLALHMNTHKKNKPCINVNCSICGKTFKTEEGLKNHISRPHRPHRLPCEVCGKMLRNDSLKTHMSAVHFDIKPYQCDICAKKFCKRALIAHMNTHKEHRTKDHHCNLCEASFFDNGQLRVHILNVHERPKHLTCSICRTTFRTEEGLKKHKLRPHRFPCKVCGKMYKKDLLKIHLDAVHLKIKPYECDICGKKCSKTTITAHMNTHKKHRTKDFQCTICESSFFDNGHLRQHILGKHIKPKHLTCSLCGRICWTVEGLKRHEQLPHLFPCEVCGKMLRKNGLKSHMNAMHFKIKPFQCDICGKKCEKTHLAHHVKTHIDFEHRKKDFQCYICETSFFNKNILRRHIINVHESRKNLNNSSKIDCKTCGKVFQGPNAYFNHMINIHKITPSKEQLQTTVACDVCGKRFFTIQNLKMHKFYHEEKNYICDYPGCEKKFKAKRNLSKHTFMNHK
ncbi:CLUMA_CG000548, isoform A [Clunio marinus]|uniref:CLUMA_CG000548, isoform A n=1 Tax=Clunio marinus TaxID=568069 RepID=A0A1J1HFT2_9DIPT|nr:CLUMA_CG000548, isoform A [Clunio marinus]